MTTFPYEAETDGIIVRVRPSWLSEESSPAQGRYIWAYQIEIENRAPIDWTLQRRHWSIVDANGQRQTVDGDGVLTAPSGIMSGYFELENLAGDVLQAKVPTFSLDSPYERSKPS